MLYPLLLMIAAFYLMFTCALLMNMRAEILRARKAHELGAQAAQRERAVMYFDSLDALLQMDGHGVYRVVSLCHHTGRHRVYAAVTRSAQEAISSAACPAKLRRSQAAGCHSGGINASSP